MLSQKEAIETIRRFVRRGHRENDVYLDDPKLRYLTREQAEEWLNVGGFPNVHTMADEVHTIAFYSDQILAQVKEIIVLVDLGCGDGSKAAQLIGLFHSKGHHVSRYFAVDVNRLLAGEAVGYVLAHTKLEKEQCQVVCSSFEDLACSEPCPWHSRAKGECTVVHLLLGNIFNNFEPSDIVDLLRAILLPSEKAVIGAKIRISSSPQEIRRIVDQYLSYGNSFTFSFGRLLGLSDEEMRRSVRYNSALNRVEVWIETSRAVDILGDGVGTRELLVCNSYRPTIGELTKNLVPFFDIRWWELSDGDDIIVLCTRCAESSVTWDVDSSELWQTRLQGC